MAELLTTRDVQQLIRVDKSTIYRMAEGGRIPAIKVGRQWRFPAEQLDAWLREQHPATAHASVRPPGASPASPTNGDLRTMLPVDAIQSTADLLADLMGVMVIVTTMDGTAVTEVSNPCGLFEFASKAPGVVERCIDDWKRYGDGLDLEPRFRPSHLGFLCARAFIRVGDRLAGMVIVGGIAPDAWPPAPDAIALLAGDLGLPTEDLAAHVEEVFRQSEGEQQRTLALLPRIGVLVSRLASERSHLVSRLEAIAMLAGAASEPGPGLDDPRSTS